MWLIETYELAMGLIIIIAIAFWVGKLIFWNLPRMIVEMKKTPGLLKPWVYYILSMASLCILLAIVSNDIGNIIWMSLFIVVPILFLMILHSPDIDKT
jgi:hypothetical protein